MTTIATQFEGVRSVSGSSERDTIFPAPPTGQKVYNRTTKTIEEWSGSAWLPILGTGFGDLYNVMRYGAVGDGVADDTAAIQACIDAAGDNAVVFLPGGTYKVTSTLTIASDRVRFIGEGITITSILFLPTAADVCISVKKVASADIAQGVVSDLKIYSTDTTYAKTALELVAVSGFRLENLYVYGFNNQGSIGLLLKGHEVSSVRGVIIIADQPIVIDKNPVTPTIDLDHFHFSDLYLIGTAYGPLVSVVTGAYLSNVTFDGYQAWVGGTHGFYWLDTTSSGISEGLVFRNIRFEQCVTAATSYLIAITHNTNLQNVVVEACYGGVDRGKGFYFRKCENVTLQNIYYTGGVGAQALDVTATVKRIAIINCFWQSLTTASIVGQRLLFGAPLNPNSGPLPPTAFYDESANALAEPSLPAIRIAGAAVSRSGTDLIVGNTHQSTVGAAGGASALPATPLGYLIAYLGTTEILIPYYSA